MLKSSRPGIRCFARNTRGNIAILFGLAVIPILLGIGVAIDYGRALVVRERINNAVDASALAIGSWTGLTDAELRVKAQQFFDANYPSSTLGTIGTLKVTFPGNDIVVEVTGAVPTTLMRLANFNSINIGARAVITVKQRNIELALVLDTTGSMRGSKMTSLKNAANEMVKTLFEGKAVSPDVKIAVIPFSGAVNIGAGKLNSGWLDKATHPNTSAIAKEDHKFSNGQSALKLFQDLNMNWGGCVRERGGAYELTDDAPTSTNSKFAPYFAPDEPDRSPENHAKGIDYRNDYIEDGNCGTNNESKRKPNRCQRYTKKYKDPDWQPPDGDDDKGPDYNCSATALTPLTSVKSTVTSAINALTPNGFTVIPAGLLWGWRVLSPGEPFTEGAPYDSEQWVKAIVVLTDGKNNVNGTDKRAGHNKSYYNAFGHAKKGHLGAKNGSEAEDELDVKTAAVCSAIKAKGIVIFTIGFRINDQTTKNLLKNCATEPGMAYVSPSNSELAGIFASIALGLSDLRIAQ